MMRFAGTIATLVLVGALLVPGAGAQEMTLATCDERVRRAPDQLLSYSCYGFLALQRGMWGEALGRLDGHVAADPQNAYALGALAYVEKVRGRPRAEELLRRLLELQDGRGDTPLQERLWARLELVDFLAQRFRLDEADAVLAGALDAAVEEGDASAVTQVRVNQAWQAWRRADHGRAGLMLRAVEDEAFRDENPHTRLIWLSAMGAVHWAQGAHDAALDCYERQAALLEELGALYQRAGVLYNIALVTEESRQGRAGSSGVARGRFEAAREAAAAVGDLAVEAAALAELAGLTDSVEQRRRWGRRGLELARRGHRIDAELANLRWLAISLYAEEPRDEATARERLAELERRTGEIGDPIETARSRAVLAHVAWSAVDRAAGDAEARERAVRAHLAHLDAIEAIRNLQPETLARARTFSRWRSAYTSLVTRLLAPGGQTPTPDELGLAFEVMERMRARLLLDEMDAARVTAALLDRDDPRAWAREETLRRIAGVQRGLLDPSLSGAERVELLERLERLEVEEATVRHAILSGVDRLARLTEPRIPSLDELREILAEDEAFLAFQVAETMSAGPATLPAASHLLVVTREGVRAYDLPYAAEIEAAVELYVGLIANRDGSERVGAARLYRDLLGAALTDLEPGITRLVVAPHGILHRLPFAALLDDAADPGSGERRSIAVVPSATVLARWRAGSAPHAPRSALAFVDPELPTPPDDPTAEDAASVARVLLPWTTLASLPRARDEARSIRRHLGRGARWVEGAAATERLLKRTELGEYAILHFAAHAVVDDAAPERSAVILAAGEGVDDGLLQVREVANLDLDGKVVVLSACRSAAGHAIATEGLISLARAFLVSGARAVVGSLWPLRDDEAAAFFDRFYRHLGTGASLDAALTAAQDDRATAAAPTAAWAGIVLIGDGSWAPLAESPPGWRSWRTALIALAVLLLLAAALVLSRSRRTQTGTQTGTSP